MKLFVRQFAWEINDRDQPYIFFTHGDTSRNVTSSQWTQIVKQAFKRWSPNKTACPPKILR